MKIHTLSLNTLLYQAGFILFMTAIITYPYLFLLNIYYPSTLLHDKNIYIYLLTFCIVLSFLLQWKQILVKLGFDSVVTICFFPVIIIILRYWVYNEGIKYLFLYRIAFMPIIYLGVGYYYLKKRWNRRLIENIILMHAFIQCICGILHRYFYSVIQLDIFPGIIQLWKEGTRVTGLLMDPGNYANFIVLGMFVLMNPYRESKLPKFIDALLTLLFVCGLSLSASRWPFMISICLIIANFIHYYNYKRFILLMFIGFPAFLYMSSSFTYIVVRLIDTTRMLRLVKIKIAFIGLIENLRNLIIGIAFNDTIISKIDTDIGQISFSDNSYLLLMITFGIPVAFVCILIFMTIFNRIVDIKNNSIILIYFIFTLFLYNSILWDIWLFYFFITLFLVKYYPTNPKDRTEIACL